MVAQSQIRRERKRGHQLGQLRKGSGLGLSGIADANSAYSKHPTGRQRNLSDLGVEADQRGVTGQLRSSQCHGSGLLPEGSAQSGWNQPNLPALAFIHV